MVYMSFSVLSKILYIEEKIFHVHLFEIIRLLGLFDFLKKIKLMLLFVVVVL